MAKNEPAAKKKPFKAISFALTVVIPLLALGFSVFIIYTVKSNLPKRLTVEEEIIPENILTPSQILKEKFIYTDKIIVVRGRVKKEQAVCEKKECPKDDPCCGCPEEINLYLYDAGSSISQQTKSVFRLLDTNLLKPCQRKPLKCEYACGDWENEAIYNITGKFFAEKPPPGLNISFDHYFTVYEKEFAKKPNFGEKLQNIINDIKQFIGKTRTSGSFVLPN